MLKYVNTPEGCAGKTIRGIFRGPFASELIVAFEDGTYTTLEAEDNGDGPGVFISYAGRDAECMGDFELAAGVITQEEFDANAAAKEQERETAKRSEEYSTLNELVAKYPEEVQRLLAQLESS